jgi:hypothetical protein
MKKVSIGIFIILITGICYAQQTGRQTIIVPPCVNRDSGFNEKDIEMLTGFIINAIQNQDRFDVPDREVLVYMTEEAKFQMGDWSDDTKLIQIGKALNANYTARSILASLDDEVNLLTVRIVDLNTTRILGRAAELEFTTLRDARAKMDSFISTLIENVPPIRASVVFAGDTISPAERNKIIQGLRDGLDKYHVPIQITASQIQNRYTFIVSMTEPVSPESGKNLFTSDGFIEFTEKDGFAASETYYIGAYQPSGLIDNFKTKITNSKTLFEKINRYFEGK